MNTIEIEIDELIIARFPSATDLGDNVEAIAELLFDSIELFAIRTGLRTERFADAYKVAVVMIINTFDKPHLRGICRFKQLSVITALRWIKSRLLNNLKTVLTNPKSRYWLGHAGREQAAGVYFTFKNVEIETELVGLSCEQIIAGLHVMFRDGEDVSEIEYLAERFGVDIDTVIGRYAMPVIVENTPCGNAQIALNWGV